MEIDERVISQLEKDSENREYQIYYRNKIFLLKDVIITKSTMPVNKPTSRGGIYSVSDKEYKIKGTINDLSILPFISKMMLGPNTEFDEVQIKTRLEIEKQNKECVLYAYLTNAMNNSTKTVLTFLIIRVKIE